MSFSELGHQVNDLALIRNSFYRPTNLRKKNAVTGAFLNFTKLIATLLDLQAISGKAPKSFFYVKITNKKIC